LPFCLFLFAGGPWSES